jgi:serralysin
MAYLQHVTTLSGVAITYGEGIVDLEIVWYGTEPFLYSGAFSDGGIGRYALSDGLPAVEVQQVVGSARNGQLGLSDLGTVEVAGVNYLFAPGRYGDLVTFRAFRPDGGIGGIRDISLPPGVEAGGISQFATVSLAGKDFLVTAVRGEAGLNVFWVMPDFSLQLTAKVQTAAKTPLETVSDLEIVVLGSKAFILAACAGDGGLVSLRLNADGTVATADMLSAALGVAWANPTAIATIQTGEGMHAVLGAAGTGTLTVLRITDQGIFVPTDHKLDDLTTRFGGVQDIATFSHQGRHFVVAGGADDGIALFELGPGGRLYHLQSIAHQLGWTLKNVSAIEAVVTGNQAQIFVAGEGVGGITQFAVDLTRFGVVRLGGDTAQTLNGTALDDHLEAGAGGGTLSGGNGADRLVAGTGTTVMWGGSGADVFVFRPGHGEDWIKDFQRGTDRIDLSGFEMLYSVTALDIAPTQTGAILRIGADTIHIDAMNGRTIQPWHFTQEDFIFV